MDDMTRRQAIKTAATAGAIATGIALAGRDPAQAQEQQPKARGNDGQVTIDVRELEQAFDKFEKATADPADLARDNVCDTYKEIRPTLEIIIKGLEAISIFFPVAGQAAAVIKKLMAMLDVFCP